VVDLGAVIIAGLAAGLLGLAGGRSLGAKGAAWRLPARVASSSWRRRPRSRLAGRGLVVEGFGSRDTRRVTYVYYTQGTDRSCTPQAAEQDQSELDAPNKYFRSWAKRVSMVNCRFGPTVDSRPLRRMSPVYAIDPMVLRKRTRAMLNKVVPITARARNCGQTALRSAPRYRMPCASMTK